MSTASGPKIEIKSFKRVKVHEQKRKNSNFLLTWNTNYRPKNREEIESLADGLVDKIDAFFADHLKECVQCVDKNGSLHPITDSEWSSGIYHVRVTSHPEVGSNFKYGARFHIHSEVYFLHSLKLRMDPKLLKDLFNKSLEGTNLPQIKYLNIQIGKISAEDYLMKDLY